MIGMVWRRLQLLAAQGVATLVGAQVVQAKVLDGEVAKAQRVEPYGLSYRPKPGAQVYLVFPAGDRAQGVALVVGDKRYQMDLAEGEVALHDDEGNHVLLGRGGVVTVKAGARVVLDAPLVTVTGELAVAGAVSVAGEVSAAAGMAVVGALTNDGANIGSTHTHPGVRAGNDSTGMPQ